MFEILGFGEKEDKIFQLLLQRGILTAPEIAQRTGLDRRIIYDTLDSLFQKGWVKKNKINNVSHFTAIEKSFIEKTAKESFTNLNSFLKEPTIGEAPLTTVNILKGPRAIAILVQEAQGSKKEVLILGRGGLTIKQLAGAKYQYISKLPKQFQFPGAFAICQDTIYLFPKQTEIMLIQIKDKSIADTFRIYFETFWKLAA